MKRDQRDALERLGYTMKEYIITYDGDVFFADDDRAEGAVPRIWGLAFYTKGYDRPAFVIEHQADEYGGNWRYYLRDEIGNDQMDFPYKLQRSAIAVAILQQSA